jgi:hypothetical protein
MDITHCYNIGFIRQIMNENAQNVEVSVQTILLLDPSQWNTDYSNLSTDKTEVTPNTTLTSLYSTSNSHLKHMGTKESKKSKRQPPLPQKPKKEKDQKHDQQPYTSSLSTDCHTTLIHPKLLKIMYSLKQD